MVQLSFRIFDLEADSQCRYDYLDVYNGNSNLVQKLGRFCGTFRPGSLISTTNTMMLDMVSDGETQGRGFVGYFSGVKPYVDGMWSHFRVINKFFVLFFCVISCIQICPACMGLQHSTNYNWAKNAVHTLSNDTTKVQKKQPHNYSPINIFRPLCQQQIS